MPEKIDDSQFPQIGGQFATLFDKCTPGQTWKLERGKDYNCKAKVIKNAAIQYAILRGLVVSVNCRDGNEVFVRFEHRLFWSNKQCQSSE